MIPICPLHKLFLSFSSSFKWSSLKKKVFFWEKLHFNDFIPPSQKKKPSQETRLFYSEKNPHPHPVCAMLINDILFVTVSSVYYLTRKRYRFMKTNFLYHVFCIFFKCDYWWLLYYFSRFLFSISSQLFILSVSTYFSSFMTSIIRF